MVMIMEDKNPGAGMFFQVTISFKLQHPYYEKRVFPEKKYPKFKFMQNSCFEEKHIFTYKFKIIEIWQTGKSEMEAAS